MTDFIERLGDDHNHFRGLTYRELFFKMLPHLSRERHGARHIRAGTVHGLDGVTIAHDDAIVVRRGTPDDAPAIVRIWESVVAERVHSAVDRPFTIESEREYINSMSDREAVFVADTQNRVVGFQTLDVWTKLHGSMDHVGQLGTFVLSGWRGSGVGRRLAEATLTFAGNHRYQKLVVFVRGSNSTAQAFYRSIGFTPCGRLTKHVVIDGQYDDEVVMERFL